MVEVIETRQPTEKEVHLKKKDIRGGCELCGGIMADVGINSVYGKRYQCAGCGHIETFDGNGNRVRRWM